MNFAAFILGCVFIGIFWYLNRRDWLRLLNESREDYRKIVNEWSIRTGGRPVYKSEAKQLVSDPQPDRGEFRILTPSMAEVESMESDERAERNGEMSPEDFAHLQRIGVLPK